MESLDTKLKREDILASDNLCDQIKDDDLIRIGSLCVNDFNADEDSMSDWRERNEKAYEILEHTFKSKSQPWPKAANAKLPLVLNAAIRFNSEAGGELLRGDELVKTEIFGEHIPEKLQRASRVASWMNYQLYHQMDNWDGDMDQLLVVVPILGCVHKKVYFDPISQANISELCLDNVTINQETTSVKKARVSQEFTKDKNDIHEREAFGIWREIDYTADDGEDQTEDGAQEFIEQHRRIDLDGDGYQEPYIVTVHKRTERPVRIVANYRREDILTRDSKVVRIEPNCHFVKYEFVPAYDGSYWALGWGILLGPLNDHINTIINQLLDAGTLANMQGGWISSTVRTKHGDNMFQPGEFKTVKVSGGTLRDSIVPLPIKEPSQTMFALLGLLLEQGQDITSVNDIMQGDQPQANMSAASVMALIEQGKKTFNAIYKRLYRSLKAEFSKLYDLNYQYADAQIYQAFHDNGNVFPQEDFGSAGYDVVPTANPEFSSRVQRMAQAEALMNTLGHPNINDSMVLLDYYSAVLDDEKKAAQYVSVQPNLSPEQVMQEMERAKQQMLDELDVQKGSAERDIKELDREITFLKLQIAQAEAGDKVGTAAAKAEQADYNAFEAALKADLLKLEKEKKEKENEKVEAEIRKIEAEAKAQEEETELLKREASRDTEED